MNDYVLTSFVHTLPLHQALIRQEPALIMSCSGSDPEQDVPAANLSRGYVVSMGLKLMSVLNDNKYQKLKCGKYWPKF